MRINSDKTYLFSLLTGLAQVRRPRLGILLVLKRALFRLGVGLFYLFTGGLGPAVLTRGTVVVLCGFGRFGLSLRSFLRGILGLRPTSYSVIRDR
jgi:hypothetical protein